MNYDDITLCLDTIQVNRRNILFSLLENKKIHFRQFPILEFIMKNNGCTQSELAEFLCISPATIAVSTKRMQKSGLIEKRENQDNLRQKNLFITEAGKIAHKECREIFEQVNTDMYKNISDIELLQLKDTLDRINLNISDNCSCKLEMNDIYHINQKHRCIQCDKRVDIHD